MALTTLSLRIDDGLIKAYESLGKRLRVPTAHLLREALFLALLHIDPSQTGKVRFSGGR